jgi:hypothetical protein
MNVKTLKMVPLIVATALAAGSARAQVNFNVPSKLPIPTSTLTRAEVKADLLIWRASGLQDLQNQVDRRADLNTLEYAQALAKYNYMLNSPQFAVLVSQISRGASPRVALASR